MSKYAFALLLVCGMSAALNTAGADTLQQPKCKPSNDLSASALERKPGSEKESFMRAYAETECFVEEAARSGAQWLKTEQILNQSFQAAEDGNWDKAFQLVSKAHFQAETALHQAGYESRAWERRVIRAKETGK